jgi:hypothetical protein
MANAFKDIKAQVEEKMDGRTLSEAKHSIWANMIRKQVATNVEIAGIHGLYFLFKEATVVDGSVAGQGRYEVPDDYICDLQVFYDRKPLMKEPPGFLDIMRPRDDTSGTPTWFEMEGQVFNIRPAPSDAEKEILLFYNGLPGLVPSSNNDSFEDTFMIQFPALHVFGMTEQAAESLGLYDTADRMSTRFQNEMGSLKFQNRRWHLSNAKIRFINWDEYEDAKIRTFPQFSL